MIFIERRGETVKFAILFGREGDAGTEGVNPLTLRCVCEAIRSPSRLSPRDSAPGVASSHRPGWPSREILHGFEHQLWQLIERRLIVAVSNFTSRGMPKKSSLGSIASVTPSLKQHQCVARFQLHASGCVFGFRHQANRERPFVNASSAFPLRRIKIGEGCPALMYSSAPCSSRIPKNIVA